MSTIIPLLSIKDVAVRLAFCEQHVYRLMRRGDFPVGFKIGGAVRFEEQDIEDYIAAQKQGLTYKKYLETKKRSRK